MEKQEYLKQWSEKISIPVAQVEQEFLSLFNEEKLIHKDLSLEQQEMRALKRLGLTYRKQMKSPAIGFEGICVAISDAVDIVAKQKREAQELFRADPITAVSQGITNEEGIPLDSRELWSTGRANPAFGKPLPEHNYLRNIWVVAKKTNSEVEPRLYQMLLSGEKAQNENIPIFKPMRFMAIDKEDKLNPSQFTTFVVDETLALPKIETILKQFIDTVDISQLEAYNSANKTEQNRLCVVEGDCSMLNLEPTAFGSRIMVVENTDNIESLDAPGLTCWLPPRVNINFGEGSKVLVIGRTGQGFKKDEAGNKTGELGDVTLNTFGVYALPKFKVEMPDFMKPITEENSDI